MTQPQPNQSDSTNQGSNQDSVETYDQPESGASADTQEIREIRQSSPASDRSEQKQEVSPEEG